jgi:hypothetical protein
LSSDLSLWVGILSFLVFLALEGVVLATATRIALRILKYEGLSFRKLVVSGLAQAGAAGFFIAVIAQAIQIAALPGIIIIVAIVLLIGLAEMRRNVAGSFKQILAPWGLSSLLQVLFGLPAAFVLMWLVLAILNILFPLSS